MSRQAPQNHFAVLGLPVPSTIEPLSDGSVPGTGPSLAVIKRAYRRALLRHHPDKQSRTNACVYQCGQGDGSDAVFAGKRGSVSSPSLSGPGLTVDAVRLAFDTLSNPNLYRAYVHGLLYGTPAPGMGLGSESGTDARNGLSRSSQPAVGRADEGVESVDLDQMTFFDFGSEEDSEGEEQDFENTATAKFSSTFKLAIRTAAAAEGISEPAYLYPCRCGFPLGFLVTESELEEAMEDAAAEAYPQTQLGHDDLVEAAVGCRGCSLWIKVTFQSAPPDDG